MKFYRKILQCKLQKYEPEFEEGKKLRVYCGGGDWGYLTDIDALGRGYVKFDNGSGQLIRNWHQLFNMIEIIEFEEKK